MSKERRASQKVKREVLEDVSPKKRTPSNEQNKSNYKLSEKQINGLYNEEDAGLSTVDELISERRQLARLGLMDMLPSMDERIERAKKEEARRAKLKSAKTLETKTANLQASHRLKNKQLEETLEREMKKLEKQHEYEIAALENVNQEEKDFLIENAKLACKTETGAQFKFLMNTCKQVHTQRTARSMFKPSTRQQQLAGNAERLRKANRLQEVEKFESMAAEMRQAEKDKWVLKYVSHKYPAYKQNTDIQRKAKKQSERN
jgi:hypothetical protein